jgi:sugar phosphate isomerase/epimerase
MKIGISSPAFALKPFVQTLDTVASEFELWEIVADLQQLLPNIAAEFKQHAPSYDLTYNIHAPFNDLNLAALNPKLRSIAISYIKDSLITADELGINLVSFHPGHFCPSGIYAPEKVQKTNLASIREIAEFASDYNLTLALENMPVKHWTLGNKAEDILEMIGDTQLGFCFDVGHAHIIQDVDNFLTNVDRFFNVHIHDNNGRRDEHLVLGEGSINLHHIIDKLNNGYSGNIIIESNNIEEGIQSKKFLQNLME